MKGKMREKNEKKQMTSQQRFQIKEGIYSKAKGIWNVMMEGKPGIIVHRLNFKC